MLEKIKELLSKCKQSADLAESSADVNDLRVRYLGKSGEYTGLLRGLKDVAPAERGAIGKLINEGKIKIETLLAEKERYFKAKEEEKKLRSEKIDVTLSKGASIGSTHPITKVKNEILDTFIGLGFAVKEGPEIETDYYNFQTLGIPADHPARDMQDTFYISENILLRTHTSPMQSRTMLSQKPPIRIVVPGKVYRADDDATHSPIFNQIEGLCVEEGISLAHLKNMLEIFAKSTFNKDTKVRFRPSYFPFTEPSV
ncbi:MAG TPA: phenylalanine--tRNA ligase subunit alpha, partial [Clostridiales bacterium]|nr:phenylalanine--tRNA ligase subunit alpha [Clostridiales bacterium]